MVDDPARTGTLLKVVPMRYAKIKMPSWRTGVLKAIRAIPAAQIWDALTVIIVLIGMIAFLVVPIWFSLLMPTGT